MTQTSEPAGPGRLERAIRSDRVIVICAVAAIVLLAALYTLFGVGMPMSAIEMTRPAIAPTDMATAFEWSVGYAGLIFLMWWIMMIAMMTPSAAPTLLLFAALKRQGPEHADAPTSALAFLTGYLIAWAAFSAVATTGQWSLQVAGLISAQTLSLNSGPLAGAALIAAGLYQLSPLKAACLRHCRSPVQFLTEHRRSGTSGALVMGMRHGMFCLGCCWVLMALLFVGGIMNLYWIVGLAIYVALEKLLRAGAELVRWSAIALIAVGVILLVSGLFTT